MPEGLASDRPGNRHRVNFRGSGMTETGAQSRDRLKFQRYLVLLIARRASENSSRLEFTSVSIPADSPRSIFPRGGNILHLQ